MVFCIFVCPGLAQTDDLANDDNEQAMLETWRTVYDSIIGTFQVRQNHSKSTESQELVRQAILSVNNPQFQMRHGRVYLWSDQGRPSVLCSIVSSNDREMPQTRRVTFEFHSLSQHVVSAARDGKVFWRCAEPGLKWIDGIDESLPSNNRTTRLAQMKSISRRFSAEGPANVFRLMPTPIYRYPSETLDVTDGAIFTFSLGTDPCVLLLVEARSNAWHLAFARSNVRELKIKTGEELVLMFEDVSLGETPTGPFYLKWTSELRSTNDPGNILFKASLPELPD